MKPTPSLLRLIAALLSVASAGFVAAEPLSKPIDNRLHIQRGAIHTGTAFLGASGGQAPYSFDVDTAALPAGLAVLPDGRLVGMTCANDGAYLLGLVTASDAAGARNTDASLVLTIDAAAAGACTLVLEAQWPQPVVGQPYRAALSAQGGAAPYTFVVASGALPVGLTLSSSGLLSGTPTIPAEQHFTLAVRDTRGATGVLTLALTPVAVNVTPPALDAAVVGEAHSQTLVASGGSGPYTFAVTSGILPAGMSLSRSGRLGGTPTTSGQTRFTVTVTDASGITVTRNYALRVAAPGLAAARPTSNGSASSSLATPGSMNAVHGMAAAAANAAVQAVPADANPVRVARQSDAGASSPSEDPPAAGTDPTLTGLQSAELEALKRLGGAQLRNVQSRLDGDTDCRPGWEQNIHLNTEWRDARPAGSGFDPNAGASRPGCARGVSMWAAGTLDYGRVGGSPATAGSRFSTPGITAGVDLAPLSGVRSGIALGRGQDRSEVGGDSGRVDSRADSVIAYGSWQAPRGLRVNASLGQSRTLLDTQRTVIAGDTLALQGQRRATQRYGALSGSTRFDVGHWQFAPRVGIEHMRAFVDAYAEDDVSPLALGYDSTRLTSSDLHGGVALTRQWKPALWTVEPQLSLDWHRRLQGNVSQSLRYLDDAFGSTGYTLASVEPASEFALLGVGVRLSQPQGWSLSLGARSTFDGSSNALRSTGYTAAVQRPF